MTIDREDLLLYAVHQLPPAREAEVQAALDADPTLWAHVQDDLDALTLLLDDLDLTQVTVPEDSEERLLSRIRMERSVHAQQEEITSIPFNSSSESSQLPDAPAQVLQGRRTGPPAWWAALALVAAAAMFFALRPPTDPLQRYVNTPGAVATTVKNGQENIGTLVRLPDGRVYVHLVRPADAGRTYQLWQIQAGKPVSLGVFGAQGVLTAPLTPGATLAVSVEPPGGSPQPTTKPLFAQTL